MAAGAPAQADPTDSEQAVATLGALEDHHADEDHGSHESGEFSTDRFVIEQDELVADEATEPLAVEGVMPDLEDLPQEFLKATPAGQVPLTGGASNGPETLTEATAGAAVPPPPTKSLPATLDATAGWQPTYSCDPNNRPGMVAFSQLVSKHYNRPGYYTSRRCLSGDNSQHYDGRAMDWSMNAYNADDLTIGNAAATWLTKNNGEIARRFGIMSIIWNKKSWYVSTPSQWVDYNGPSPHTDHLHISFTWDGAMKRTSWWTGTPVTQIDHGTCRVYALQYAPRYTARRTTPCPTSLPAALRSAYPVVLPGANSDTVATAQAHLGFKGLDVDGGFGPMTLDRLLTWQRDNRVPVTGVLDNATWFDFATGVSRVSGTDRYGTAANLSLFTRTGGDVYVTTGENYPDALAASARAGAVGAPVLLVKATSIPDATRTALSRAEPRRIFVVGGDAAIASNVLTGLRPYASSGTVSRIAGVDRYATAAQLSKMSGTSVPVVYVATGANYPAALVGAARAASSGAPVLLTRKGELPAATVEALRSLNPGRIVVVGGTGEVASTVVTALKPYSRSGEVLRVSGDSHYATAASLAGYYPSGLDVVYVATVANYPDALAAAARAGDQNGPVLLTSPSTLPTATRAALEDLSPRAIIVVGGPAAVSSDVVKALAAYAD